MGEPEPLPDRKVYLWGYGSVLAYGAFCIVASPIIGLVAVATLGLLSVSFFAMYLAGPPTLAAIVGWQSRWSPLRASLVGFPIVVLAVIATPLGPSAQFLGVPVPWISGALPDKDVLAQMRYQGIASTCVFVAAFVAGLRRRKRASG